MAKSTGQFLIRIAAPCVAGALMARAHRGDRNHFGNRSASAGPLTEVLPSAGWSRRRLIASLGAGSLALAGAGSVRAGGPAGGGGGDSRLEAVVKLRGSLDERPVWLWLIGKRYVVTPDGRSLPLCSVYNVSLTRWRRESPQGYGITVLEYNYNTDFDTGLWRDTLVMPLTGRAVPAPVGRAEPVVHHWSMSHQYDGTVGKAGEFSAATVAAMGADSALTIDRRIHGPEALGDEVSFVQDWFLRIRPAVPAPGRRGWWVREVATVRGSLRDVEDPSVLYAESRTSYAITYAFQPWMQLDDQEGWVVTAGIGGKTDDRDKVPESILRILAARNPEALGDPRRLLGP